MIHNSFIFLEKISTKKERNIWKQGITTWNAFLRAKSVRGISREKKYFYDRKIQEAQRALTQDNIEYFVGKLKQKEVWRLYERYKEEACFLDIEVDSYGNIIVVGISNHYTTNFFVKGSNLEKNCIERELQKYKLIVTFNGASFDLPKLRKQHNTFINCVHLDLKPLCVNLGLKGGLKEVEKILELKRPEHLYGNPIDLWKAFHASGDREYLELLLEYNKEDCENLKFVANHVYTLLKAKSLAPHENSLTFLGY